MGRCCPAATCPSPYCPDPPDPRTGPTFRHFEVGERDVAVGADVSVDVAVVLRPVGILPLGRRTGIGPFALKLTVSPESRLMVTGPGKPHCWQVAGASGAGGNACAGPAAVTKPGPDNAAAAAISGNVLCSLPFGIGTLHLLVSVVNKSKAGR